MQVVLLGHVLGLEELPHVLRLAVGVTLLRVARLVTQGELGQLTGVDQVVVGVGVPLGRGVEDGAQAEEPVEDAVVGLQVAAVLDQADPQRLAQHRLVVEHAGLCGRVHGVQPLGHADPQPVQTQQPDEPVQCLLHRRPPGRTRC